MINRRVVMNIIKEFIKQVEKIDFLFPNSFEELMNDEYYDYDKFEWFLYHVFELDNMISKVDKVGKKGKGDGGADLILTIPQNEGGVLRIGIQAKYWKNRVGAQPINQLASTKERLGLTDLWIVTTSDLTNDAIEIAKSLKIKILRADYVAKMINAVKVKYESDIEKNGESAIEFLKPIKTEKKPKLAAKPKTVEVAEDEQVEKLKALRVELSKKYNLYPIYNVFNNEVLESIINQRPTTLEDLSSIKGLGTKKIKTFGTEIIDFVKNNLVKKSKVILDVDQQLIDLLLLERTKIAKYYKIPENDVYSDKVAGYIAKMKPKDKETLKEVYGFKSENIDVFGDYLLRVISKYINNINGDLS